MHIPAVGSRVVNADDQYIIASQQSRVSSSEERSEAGSYRPLERTVNVQVGPLAGVALPKLTAPFKTTKAQPKAPRR